MLEFISMLGIGLIALEATLSLVVFHHINFKIAVIAIILAPEFYNAIKDLGQAFHTGKQSEGASDIIFDFLNNVEESNINTPTINQNQQNQIYFDKVSYQYPNTTLYALKDITFRSIKEKNCNCWSKWRWKIHISESYSANDNTYKRSHYI